MRATTAAGAMLLSGSGTKKATLTGSTAAPTTRLVASTGVVQRG